MEKKSERLEVRLGYKEKEAFTEACETQGDTPSGAIRRFINGYVRRSDNDVMSEAWRSAVSRRGLKAGLFALIFMSIAAAFWAASKHKPWISDDAVFAARDWNKDGQLKGVELGYAEIETGFLRIMDLDDSGGIDRAEFRSKGEMLYVLSGAENSPESRKPRNKDSVKMVKFHLQRERIQSGTYGVEGEMKNLDRVVFWHEGGGVSVLEGPVSIDIGEVYVTE